MARKNGSTTKLLLIAGGVVAVLVIGGIVVSSRQKAAQEAAELAATWTVSGPPCPEAAPGGPTPTRESQFGGAAFVRERASAVNCHLIQENSKEIAVCMFVGPGALKVVTTAGTKSYAPPAGVDATVYVREAGPQCVMAINRAVMN
jgi:hypothetical protein